MKVALVSAYDYAHPGGVTEHVRYLAAGLNRRGHVTTIFAPCSDVDFAQDNPEFVRVGRPVPIPAHGSVARITVSFHLMKRIKHLMREGGYDVIHFHEPLMPVLSMTALRYSQSFNVGTFHAFARSNIGYYYGKPLLKRYVRHLNVRIAVSVAARDFVQRYFPGEYRIVPNGIDVGRFARQLPLPELRDGSPTILFVGRLETRKGLGYLLRAFTQLKAEVPNLRLVIVGDGPMRRWYANVIYRRQLEDVIMAGYVSADELPRYYASCDIFCAPNTGDESFGIVLLEAMAAGKPIVATDIDGFRTVLTNGREGLLVERKSSRRLADGLRLLLQDAELRRALGEMGARTAQRYDWEHVLDEVTAIYREAPSETQPLPQLRLEPSMSPR
jgi:phosphatidyl-myo-inositol alpha-mannosyltransferase